MIFCLSLYNLDGHCFGTALSNEVHYMTVNFLAQMSVSSSVLLLLGTQSPFWCNLIRILKVWPFLAGIPVSWMHYPLLEQQQHEITLAIVCHKVVGDLSPTTSQSVTLQLVAALTEHPKTRQHVTEFDS